MRRLSTVEKRSSRGHSPKNKSHNCYMLATLSYATCKATYVCKNEHQKNPLPFALNAKGVNYVSELTFYTTLKGKGSI